MHINGQCLTPEIFIELISSKTWALSANSTIYTVTKQEEGTDRVIIWTWLREIYKYLESYWPRKSTPPNTITSHQESGRSRQTNYNLEISWKSEERTSRQLPLDKD